jgi:hypothetical protein
VIADLLRGAAALIDAVNEAQAERVSGFSEREAGDYLDAADLSGDGSAEIEEHINTLAAKLHKIRGLANGWRSENLDGIGQGDLVLHVAAGTVLKILNEGINFWTPPESDEVVDAEVHCSDCQCPVRCGCGRELYSERVKDDDPPFWYHRDDDSPINAACAHYISRVGEFVTCRCGEMFDHFSEHARHLVEMLRDTVGVTQDDLSAHIAASIRNFRALRAGNFEDAADYIASDLLADHRITKQ